MSELARAKLYELIEKKYGALIRSIAYEILCSWNDIEDVQQEVIIRCMGIIEQHDEHSIDLMKGYICTASKNVALNMKRKTKNGEDAVKEFYGRGLTMDYIDFKAFEDKYGFSIEMQEFLKTLDNLDRDIICLKYGEGFSDEEIAAIVCKSVSAVQKRNYRARLKLKSILVDRNMDE